MNKILIQVALNISSGEKTEACQAGSSLGQSLQRKPNCAVVPPLKNQPEKYSTLARMEKISAKREPQSHQV